jgi:hypothetical protein
MKKVQKSLGTRSKSNSTVAPLDDRDGDREEGDRDQESSSGQRRKRSWVDPNTKDYSKT